MKTSLQKPITKSLLLHGMLCLLILVSLLWQGGGTPSSTRAEHGTPAAISATAVDMKQVKAEVNRLKQAELAKQLADQKQKQEMQHIQEQTLAAKRERVKEQARIRQMQLQQKVLAEKKKAEALAMEKQLAVLKEKQKNELNLIKQQQLEAEKKIQQQKAEAAKQLAQLEKQRLAKEAAAEQALKQAEAAAPQAKPTATKAVEEKKAENLASAQEEAARRALADSQARAARESDSHMAGIVDRYSSLIRQAVEQNWIIPEQSAKKNLACVLSIRLSPSGTVLAVQVLTSSGDTALDSSAIAAVYKASPLPVPNEAEIFDNKFRQFNLSVKPEGLINTG